MTYSLKRATSWNLAGYVYLLIASFVTTPGLIARLGLPDFGRYALYMGIAAVASSLDLGLYRSIVYHLAISDEQKQQDIHITSFWLYTALALVSGSCVAYFFGIPLGLYVAVNFLLSQALALWEARGHFGKVNMRSFVVGTANTFGALAIARYGGGVDGIMYGLTVSVLIILIYAHPTIRSYFDKEIALRLIKYGAGNQLGKVVGQLQGQYAKFLFAGNAVSLSAYTVASSIVSRTVGGVTQASTALFPHSASTSNRLQYRRLYYSIQGVLLLAGLGAVTIYGVVGYPFLMWWLKNPELVSHVHSFLLIYRWYALLLLLTPIASTTIDSMGKPAITSLFGVGAVVTEIIFAVATYRTLGINAPAYGALISLVIFVPSFLWVTEKILVHGEK